MARSLTAHSRRLAAREALETIRQRVLPLVWAAILGALMTMLFIGGVGI